MPGSAPLAAAPLILIVDADTTHLAYLSVSLKKAGFATVAAANGKDGLALAQRQPPPLILLSDNLPDLKGLELVRKLRADRRLADTKILLMSQSVKPDDILAGMQAGANEYVQLRLEAQEEVLERVRALLPGTAPLRPPANPTAPLSGKLISFLSAKGGTGTSSLCANLAQLLAEQVSPRRVVVVDLVLPIGSIGQIVGAETDATVVTVSQWPPTAVTPAQLRQKIGPVPGWGFCLLPGAPDPEAAQTLAVDRLEPLFTALGQAFDFVLVDFGRALSRISLPIIRKSARIVMVVSSDLSTVSLTGITLKYFEQQEIRRNRVFPILNRAVGLEGLSAAEVERQLSLKIAGIVPHLGDGFALANNQHRPLALKFPDTAATFALHQLADGLLRQLEGAGTA